MYLSKLSLKIFVSIWALALLAIIGAILAGITGTQHFLGIHWSIFLLSMAVFMILGIMIFFIDKLIRNISEAYITKKGEYANAKILKVTTIEGAGSRVPPGTEVFRLQLEVYPNKKESFISETVVEVQLWNTPRKGLNVRVNCIPEKKKVALIGPPLFSTPPAKLLMNDF